MRLLACIILVCLGVTAIAAEGEKTAYVQLIWATDQPRPAGKDYREVGPKLSRKLSPVFKWKHYWEIDRKKVQLDPHKTTSVALPKQRRVEIEFVEADNVEVRLYRRSGLVTKTRQAVDGRMVILGGEEDSKNYFFVVVRPDEPKNGE